MQQRNHDPSPVVEDKSLLTVCGVARRLPLTRMIRNLRCIWNTGDPAWGPVAECCTNGKGGADAEPNARS